MKKKIGENGKPYQSKIISEKELALVQSLLKILGFSFFTNSLRRLASGFGKIT